MPTSEESVIINCINYKLNKLTKKVNCLSVKRTEKGPIGEQGPTGPTGPQIVYGTLPYTNGVTGIVSRFQSMLLLVLIQQLAVVLLILRVVTTQQLAVVKIILRRVITQQLVVV